MGDLDSLREREKELRCLYQVQHLTLGSGLPLEQVLQKVAECLPPGWQRPDETGARIEYFEQAFVSSNYHEDAPKLSQELRLGGQAIGRVLVSDLGLGSEASADEVFLEEERELLRGVSSLLSNFLEWRHLEALGEHLSERVEGEKSVLDVEAMVRRTLLGLSHELRNPLTVITADLDLLRQELPRQERDEVVSELQQAVTGMSTMISDFMLFLRAETGVEKPPLEETDLHQFVDAVVGRYTERNPDTRVLFQGKDLGVKVKLHRNTTERILGDLIRNGVLYSNSDQVLVTLHPPQDGRVMISVEDEGRGIDQEHQDKIFEQFYRLESSRDRFSGGVGLGLPLARALARSQNGSLGLVSEPGRGTEVQLSFSVSGRQHQAEG